MPIPLSIPFESLLMINLSAYKGGETYCNPFLHGCTPAYEEYVECTLS